MLKKEPTRAKVIAEAELRDISGRIVDCSGAEPNI
jgi:hypothetical protein